MTWVDELSRVRHPDGRFLIGASFRGVPFFVEDATRTGGRRTAKHEFVDADVPGIDDLGKVGNDFRLTGYVLGDRYLIQKRQLLAALQDIAGPGDLVSPYDGHQRVQCGPVTTNESKKDGGICTFQIQFSHAPVRTSPTSEVDLKVVVIALAADVIIVNSASLVEASTVVGQAAFAIESLSADLSDVSRGLEERLAVVVLVTQELAQLSVQIDLLVAEADAFVRAPADMLEALLEATQQLAESIPTAPLEIVRALISTINIPSPDAAIGATETRIAERANQIAYADALRLVLASEAARIITEVDFESIEQATDARDLIVDALDDLAATAGSTTYADVVNLRSAVLRAIPGDAALASVETITQHTDIPSLALSYRLYGNVDSAADLVARNKIAHPGYMSGDLNVLSDVD